MRKNVGKSAGTQRITGESQLNEKIEVAVRDGIQRLVIHRGK